MNSTLNIKCPRCGQPSVYSPENQFRPFCSERCKLIDLGQWANEGFVISSAPSTQEELEQIAAALEEKSESDEDPIL